MSRQSDYADGYYAELAKQVSKGLAKDNARKARILAGSPDLRYSLDARTLDEMSAAELAKHELEGFGIKVSANSDPLEVRDAFHAGRAHERRAASGAKGWAGDSGGGDTFIDRYLDPKE